MISKEWSLNGSHINVINTQLKYVQFYRVKTRNDVENGFFRNKENQQSTKAANSVLLSVHEN